MVQPEERWRETDSCDWRDLLAALVRSCCHRCGRTQKVQSEEQSPCLHAVRLEASLADVAAIAHAHGCGRGRGRCRARGKVIEVSKVLLWWSDPPRGQRDWGGWGVEMTCAMLPQTPYQMLRWTHMWVSQAMVIAEPSRCLQCTVRHDHVWARVSDGDSRGCRGCHGCHGCHECRGRASSGGEGFVMLAARPDRQGLKTLYTSRLANAVPRTDPSGQASALLCFSPATLRAPSAAVTSRAAVEIECTNHMHRVVETAPCHL
jgi:hypothetical protein